jgi:hypothetical protein
LAAFAVVLMLDLVYLFTALPARGARLACWSIAAASAGACAFALRKLHDAGYLKPNLDNDAGSDAVNLSNVPDLLSLLDLDD